MKKILLVEDSRTVARMLSHRIQKTLDFPILIAMSFTEAKILLEREHRNIFVGLLDFGLPDAPNGEIIDLVQSYDIPVISFTGADDRKTRNFLISKHVVDYIYKKNIHEIDYITRLINRIFRNPDIKVLLVDDSSSAREVIKRQLLSQRFQVIEADCGETALTLLDQEKGVRLAIVDYNMPGMDGGSFVSSVRKKYGRDRLAIIGISGIDSGQASARLLKSGANDFLTKPFTNEEFLCRVVQNVENMEQLDRIRDVAFRDYLTGLYNRRYLSDRGETVP